ncbi:MAG: hypothetical protein AB7S68_14080 [Polyangiaceae bacterium]
MPAAAPAQPKSSKLPILLFIAGGGALLFSLVLGGVGGYFHYQANKAYRAEAIATVYLGSGTSIGSRLREKGDNLSMIRNVAWGTSFLLGLIGVGGFIGGFVTRKKSPAAAPALPAYSGQTYQPEGYPNPNSGVPTAPSPGAPPPSAAVSSNPYGAPPAGFGGPAGGAAQQQQPQQQQPQPQQPPQQQQPPQAPPASFQPTAASAQPAPPLPPPPAPPAPPSDRKFGGTMLMPEVDPTKK